MSLAAVKEIGKDAAVLEKLSSIFTLKKEQ